tara:strand:+ start:1673 stop:2143 length:471 start_codon:yes stop_codon:yes gene_type:complete
MNHNIKILDTELSDSYTLKKGLRKLRVNSFSTLFLFTIIYLIVEITDVFYWKYGIGTILGLCVGTILIVLFTGFRLKYIYGYTINEEIVSLNLVNFFGKKKEFVLPINQIEKIKYRKKTLSFDKIWIHLDDSIKEFNFIEKGLGDELYDGLKVEKL